MPAVIIPAIVSAAGAAGAGIATGAFTLWSSAMWVAAGISAAGSILMSAASSLLAPKTKKNNITAAALGRGSTTQNVRQAIDTHKIIYGQRRVGGPIVFASSSSSNEYMHLVIVLAAHQIESIDEVWFNETSIPNDYLDAQGNVISGKYSGYARIRKYLGNPAQSADSFLVAECPEWTSSNKLQGRAYIYVRLRYSQDLYPGGIPNISAIIKGKRILDTRDGSFKFTSNAALIAHDYLIDQQYGFEASGSVDEDSTTAAANICDEIVTISTKQYVVSSIDAATDIIKITGSRLQMAIGDVVQISSSGSLPSGLSAATDYYIIPYQFKDTPRFKLASSLANAMDGIAINITSAGSGTITISHIGEPRYHAASYLDSAATLNENLINIISAMGGKAIYAGGKWRLLAAGYTAPTISFDENDFIGPIAVQTKKSRRDQFNTIGGIYSSHINDWQAADYPSLQDENKFADDGYEIRFDLDLPSTNRPFTAQRLAKIELKKAAQDIIVNAPLNLKAMQVQAGDVIQINNDRFGWVDKEFEVVEFKFTLGGNSDEPQLGIQLTLRETASSVFDWSSSEEGSIDPAPNTNLPNAFDVDAVTGLAFDSLPVETLNGDTVYSILLSWSLHNDTFVREGGRYEIQYKLSTDVDYKPSFFVDGLLTSSAIANGTLGLEYDIRIRAVNNLGVRSNWNNLNGVIAGSSGGVGATEDWGAFTDSVSVTDDWASFGDTVTVNKDWESFT